MVAPRAAFSSADRLIYISMSGISLHATHARLCVVVAPAAPGAANVGEVMSASRCLTVGATARLAEAQREAHTGDMLAAFSLSNALSGALHVTATVMARNGQLVKASLLLAEVVSTGTEVIVAVAPKKRRRSTAAPQPTLQALWV